jgi:hypothetical protein
MRCQDIATDVKYEIKGRKYFGNFIVIEDISPDDLPGLILLTKSAGMDSKTKLHVDRLEKENDLVTDLIWFVSLDLSVVIIRWPAQRPEVFNIHSQFTTVKLLSSAYGQSVGELLREIHFQADKDKELFARLFSRLPSMNGIIENRIKLRQHPFGDIFMVARELEMAIDNPFDATDDQLSMLFIAGRTRSAVEPSKYRHAMQELKHRQIENFRDDVGVFPTYRVSKLELSARKSRAASLLKKFLTSFPGDFLLEGALAQHGNWEEKVKAFAGQLSDDELCELLLVYWMSGVQEDLRLKLLVIVAEQRSNEY